MKSIWKAALAGAALVATSSAFADVALPGSDNGELVLFVKNNTTGVVYARGLVTQINSVATASFLAGDPSYTPGKELAFSLATVGPDANLSGFLNGTDSFSYAVIAADTSFAGGTGNVLGNQRYAFTTTADFDPTFNAPLNTDLISYQNSQAAMQELNNILAGAVGNGASTASGGVWGQVGSAGGEFWQDWFGTGVQNAITLGDSSAFYLVTSGGGSSVTTSHVYLAGTYTLSATGELSFAPNTTAPAVPLPAAVWLLLSGLGGMGVIGRRKAVAAA
jgi:hypothetical protein